MEAKKKQEKQIKKMFLKFKKLYYENSLILHELGLFETKSALYHVHFYILCEAYNKLGLKDPEMIL